MDEIKRKKVIDLIKSDEAQERFFFRELNDPSWIPWLDAAGYLNVDTAPEVERKEDGSSIGVEWPILPYLARILETGRDRTELEQHIPRLVKFFKEASVNHKWNWRTLFWLAKIISFLPRQVVSEDLIEPIENWLLVPAAGSMVSADLCCRLLPNLLSGDPSPENISAAEKLLSIVTRTVELGEEEKKRSFSGTHRFLLEHHWIIEGLNKCADWAGRHLTDHGIMAVIDDVSNLTYFAIEKKPRKEEQKEFNFALQLNRSENEWQFKVEIEVGGEVILQRCFPVGVQRKVFIRSVLDELKKKCVVIDEKEDLIRDELIRLHAGLLGEQCYPAIDDIRTSYDHDPLDALICFLRNVLVERSSVKKELFQPFVDEIFERPLLIFPKLALYLVANKVEFLRPSFWRALVGANGDVLMEDLFFGAELKQILEALPPLSKEEVVQLEREIEEGSILWSSDFPEDPEYKVFWKQQRYRALSADSHFQDLYEKLRLSSGREAKLSSAIGTVEVRSGWGESPMSDEKIIELSPHELVSAFNEFVGEDSFHGPTTGGLAGALEGIVRRKPEHFIESLDNFLRLGYLWVTRILRGLNEVLEDGKANTWCPILRFMKAYSRQPAFWDDDLSNNDVNYAFIPNHTWVLGEFSSIVQKKMRKNGVGVGDHEIEELRTLLHEWLLKIEWPKKASYDDPLMQAINSTGGQVSEALIATLLCIARRAVDNERETRPNNIRWKDEDRNLFDKLITEERVEFYTLLGLLLPNLCFLDRPWVDRKVPELLAKAPWKEFMIGYFHQGAFYDELYQLLLPAYLRLEGDEEFEENSKSRRIQHITLAYLRGLEEISGEGLFSKVLNDKSDEDLLEVVRFIGRVALDSRRDKDEIDLSVVQRLSDRVILLWEFVLGRFDGDLAMLPIDRKQIFAGELLEFTAFLPVMNEGAERLILSTLELGLSDNREFAFFLEYLLAVAKRSRGEETRIGNVLVSMLDNTTPSFRKETISDVVELLSRSEDAKASACEICEKYARRGYDFLKPVYDKYFKAR